MLNVVAHVEVVTIIAAPIERCFDLSRSLAAHTETTASTGERVLLGPGRDLLELGDEVTFEAKHLGVRQKLSARIVDFEPPSYFADEMTRGAFKSLRHEHRFLTIDKGETEMRDTLEFQSPLGWLGACFDKVFLRAYMERFVRTKAIALKHLAENQA
jgi:ligand-binding SRPBCC domain-containing protein